VQNKNKKNLYKILFITILLGFIISLVGCSWLSLGLLNIFDPQAQIKVTAAIDLTEDTIEMEIYSINQVEFIGTGFEYEYYVGTTKITSLTKTVGQAFYVQASSGPGIIGEITTVSDLPLYYQEAKDYMTSNPLVTELTCTITLIGTDGAGHSISKAVTVDLPALQPGIDFVPPDAYFDVTPDPPTGTVPFTVVFDASDSYDARGIASYSWDFGDGYTGSDIIVEHTYDTVGTYIVILTATDYFGNKGYYTRSIQVNYFTAITIIVVAVPASFTGGVGGDSIITAYVIDSVGEPVEGVNVIFNTTGGRLSATSDTTDADGKATVTLTVAANTTTDPIVYQVTANVGSISGSTSITIHEP